MSSPTLTTKSTIMLVDGEEDLATLYQQFLKKMGYKIDSFTDPSIGLKNFKQSSRRYSMVLTDLRMPSMSGIELARKIREIDDCIVIDLITAYDIDEETRKDKIFQEAKIHNILEKPIRLSDLKKSLRAALEKTGIPNRLHQCP